MGQSLAQLYIHLTFGTKHRHSFINEEIEKELHSYMAGGFKNLESPALLINSVTDHIHVLFRLSKNHALAKVIEEIKRQSSIWIKNQAREYSNFSWQSGYGAFSVSSSGVEAVKNYLLKQKEHHKKVTYQKEVEEFVKHYDIIEYDPEFFWR